MSNVVEAKKAAAQPSRIQIIHFTIHSGKQKRVSYENVGSGKKKWWVAQTAFVDLFCCLLLGPELESESKTVGRKLKVPM